MPKEIITQGLDLTAQDLINNLMQNSPVDHGLLKQWAVTDSSEYSRTIQSPAIYAAAQNYGSTHFIAPKNAKALHWEGSMNMTFSGDNISISGSKGGFSMGHEVTIPAKHFVEDSIEATMGRIQEFFSINGG